MKLRKALEIQAAKRGRNSSLQLFSMVICLTMLSTHGPGLAAASQKSKAIDGPVIGIDLGTTYSCVGIYKNGHAEIIPNELGNRITPSVVGFTNEERLVGEAAKNQAPMNPTNTISVVKRLMGRAFSDQEVQKDAKYLPYEIVSKNGKPYPNVISPGSSGKKALSPEEVSSMVLTKMKTIAENYLGKEVKHAVITVPAYFNDSQRQATKDAGRIAGLEVLRILNEPTAAAIAYGLDKKSSTKEQNVLVFDLGGGTFDVSLLTLEGGVFEVLATAGDTHLGGEDFDQRLASHFAKIFKKKHGVDIMKDERALAKLKAEVEKAKRDLSSTIQTKIHIESLINGIDFEETITRARFEELCADLFKQTLKPVEKVLDDSGLKKSEVDEIVLVGGSTRIPKIQQLMKDFFHGKEPNRGINPDEAVAFGASVQGCVLSGADCGADGIAVIDVTPLSLGIETVGNVMSSIVKRGTIVPTSKSQVFTTNQDQQTTVTISIFEGERALTKDNHQLGKFDLTGIPPAPRGTPQIEVTFDIDEEGILHVSAQDKASTSSKNSIKINNMRGRLSESEIENLVAQAKDFEEADKLIKEKVDARNQLESYIHTMRNQVEDKEKLADKLDEDEKETIKKVIEEAQDWLSEHSHDSDTDKEDYEEQYKKLTSTIDPIVSKVYSKAGGASGTNTNPQDDEEEFEDI